MSSREFETAELNKKWLADVQVMLLEKDMVEPEEGTASGSDNFYSL